VIAARTLYRAWRLCRNADVDLFRIDTAELLRAIPGWDVLGLPNDDREVTTILEMLRAIELRHRDATADPSRARLVATVPPALRVTAATRDVAESLIRGAGKEILVVGYRVSEPGFMRLLQIKGVAGVHVTVVSDRGEDDAKALFDAWPAGAAALRAYRGVEPVQGQSLIHAKAIVADRARALVGSANFSTGGFRNNVELGVEIDGSIPAEIVQLVERLIEGRWLEPVGSCQHARTPKD
jgi:phosphatidylserine/phosphatidylglycerophosphate/cardiolipin synthase-like enzyme